MGRLEALQRVLVRRSRGRRPPGHPAGPGEGSARIHHGERGGRRVRPVLGAGPVIDCPRERFEEQVREADLVLGMIAAETQLRSWTVLKEGGALVSTLTLPSQQKAREHHARGSHYRTHPCGAELAEIARHIHAGKVKPRVTATHPLEQAAAAQQRIAHPHVQGKVVLQAA
jgi:NADPH:quinone reductase-like Zn-dependent oxidoreductase